MRWEYQFTYAGIVNANKWCSTDGWWIGEDIFYNFVTKFLLLVATPRSWYNCFIEWKCCSKFKIPLNTFPMFPNSGLVYDFHWSTERRRSIEISVLYKHNHSTTTQPNSLLASTKRCIHKCRRWVYDEGSEGSVYTDEKRNCVYNNDIYIFRQICRQFYRVLTRPRINQRW
jgi:hypothetical protein